MTDGDAGSVAERLKGEGSAMRIMLELPNEPALRAAYRAAIRDPERGLASLGRLLPRQLDIGGTKFKIASLPSYSHKFRSSGRRLKSAAAAARRAEERLPSLVFSLEVEGIETLDRFVDAARQVPGARAGIDLPIAVFDAWCPEGDQPSLFHTRDAASALIDVDALRSHVPSLRGQGVNVVMVDLGLNAAALAAFSPGAEVAGAWEVSQGGAPLWQTGSGPAAWSGHGTMVARNVLSVAPRVRLFDFPLLPEQVTEVTGWTSWAHAALHQVQADIQTWLSAEFPGPWVFCNAWGIYDRRQESAPVHHPGNYTGNPTHLLNLLVGAIDAAGFDQIFAAGNGGQFCPHPLCGPGDTGPGNSIFGASSHGDVLTVGAVRPDGMWIGYSSQGPGQLAFRTPATPFSEKPDLCAPSHFIEAADASALCSGTSAACGIAAGAVAALRGAGSPHASKQTSELRDHLRATARKPADAASEFDIRYGHGLLDLRAALREPLQSS
ncbi:S8 family peptidase [Roseomonas hellenica]|uniref:S8 family peptidase n=1 Tax=Plastoroseomonas hellenica TaxID=2687306 RepID=A0ABS5F0I8_9PROT|nr:S8 family serine peptidase [Plastoroseomonas hellenica]MBR0666057.1 S8 family peptidase [Plastoroseomonas hellenica]